MLNNSVRPNTANDKGDKSYKIYLLQMFVKAITLKKRLLKMFPISDNIPSRRTPIVTYTLIFINCIVFFIELSLPSNLTYRIFYTFGIVPARYTNLDWAYIAGFPVGFIWLIMPLITSMFLHGSWLHIISNMWFLWIFADNVEDRLGHVRFAIFYLLCGIAAGVAHIIINPTSTIPAIGASGAISGVLGAYFVFFPMAMIIVLIPVVFWPIFIPLPAFIYITTWFLIQFLSGTVSLIIPYNISAIAWWAHIGGFIAGGLFSRVFSKKSSSITITEYTSSSAW